MTISLVQNKNSKHFGEYRIRVQPMVNGSKIHVPVEYATTKRKAEKLEQKLITKAKAGFNFAGANEFLTDGFSKWVDHQIELDRWSYTTEQSWRFTEKMVKHYCKGLRIKQCDEDAIRKFIHDYVNEHHTTVSAHSTADKLLQQLRTYFLTLEGVTIKKSPVPKKALDYFFRRDRQSVIKDKYVMTDDELRAFQKYLKNSIEKLPVQHTVVQLALLVESETGMRPQEIQALKFSNIVQDEGHWVFKISDSYSEPSKKFNGHLKSRKIGEWRLTPPITNDLYNMIMIFKDKQKAFVQSKLLNNPKNLIFLSLLDFRLAKLGNPITQRSMNDALKNICNKIGVQSNGLPLTCYTLRTTTGTRLARLGDYSYASNRLGNSLAVYMRYYVKPLNRGYGQLMDQYLKL